MTPTLNQLSLWLPPRIRRGASSLWHETDGFAGWYPFGGCCQIKSDNFDRADDTDIGDSWTEVSGAWEIASNRIKTSSTSAIATIDTGSSNARMKTSVVARGATGDKMRLIFGYVDSSNYWFAETTIGVSGRFDLYQRASGSDTLKQGGTLSFDVAGADFSMTACVDENFNAVVQLLFGGVIFSERAAATTLTTEGVVGLGTGSAASSTTQFDDLTVSKTTGTCCDGCDSVCPVCTNRWPSIVRLTASGFTSPDTDLNGVFVLDEGAGLSGSNSNFTCFAPDVPTAGSGCNWRHTIVFGTQWGVYLQSATHYGGSAPYGINIYVGAIRSSALRWAGTSYNTSPRPDECVDTTMTIDRLAACSPATAPASVLLELMP